MVEGVKCGGSGTEPAERQGRGRGGESARRVAACWQLMERADGQESEMA